MFKRFIRLWPMAAALSALFTIPAAAADLTIQWDANTEASLAGYRIYVGTASGVYGGSPIIIGKQTTYTLSGLSSGTYYITVTAYSTTGFESGYSNQVSTVMASVDTTPPVITGVQTSAAGSTQATITWTTNENSDTQVEYGLGLSYGSSTSWSTSGGTTHTCTLTGLVAGTSYHFRVRARDAAGNVQVSGDYAFTTVDGNPPVISNVTSTPAAYSAVVRWTTNKPANSQVEYGLTGSYGAATVTNEQAGTDHMETIPALQPGTLYHYRARSCDANGNRVASADMTFTTSTQEKVTTLFYARLLTGQVAVQDPLARQFTGIGIANLDTRAATLRFTAYSTSGTVISGSGVTNPSYRVLVPGRQLPILDNELFGTNFEGTDAAGWVKIESDVEKVAGLFIMFNGRLTQLDGADFVNTPVSSFYFPVIRGQGYSRISVGNPNAEAASLSFSLIGPDGVPKADASRTIAGYGALAADLFSELFVQAAPDARDYVKVTSTRSVLPIELLGNASGDFETLRGRDSASGSTRLYSPQYILGGSYTSAISIVNVDATPGNVTLRMVGEDSGQIGATRTITIPANGKILIDGANFFESYRPNPSAVSQGYVEIVGTVKLIGSVVFGGSRPGSFSTALPLSEGMDTSVVFGHVASDDIYYTGIAIVNPNLTDAHVTVKLFYEDGTAAASSPLTIPAGCRVAPVLPELFPVLAGQRRTAGYFSLTSDVGVASFALFGTHDMSLMSAIPPQVVR